MGMRALGLVAWLMGLESMPTVHRDKPKKPSFSGNFDNGDEKFVGSHSGFDKEELNLEKGGTKQESRPQKLQKTGPFVSYKDGYRGANHCGHRMAIGVAGTAKPRPRGGRASCPQWCRGWFSFGVAFSSPIPSLFAGHPF
jgi:hypothetical protein